MAGPCVRVLFFVFWRAPAFHNIYVHRLFCYFTPGFMCISTQQLGRDWDTSYSSGIWDRKNDLTIGNGMIKKVSGQTVGSGTGERVSKSGTGTGWEASGQIVAREESGTGTVHLAVGRETREHKLVTEEVGKHRSGKEISQPFPFPYRPDHFSRPDFYRAKPCFWVCRGFCANPGIQPQMHRKGDFIFIIILTSLPSCLWSQRIG